MSGLELEKVLGFTSILVNVQTICFESMQTSVERTLNRRKAESVTLLEIMQRGKWAVQAARVSQPSIQPTVQTSWYTRATGECVYVAIWKRDTASTGGFLSTTTTTKSLIHASLSSSSTSLSSSSSTTVTTSNVYAVCRQLLIASSCCDPNCDRDLKKRGERSYVTSLGHCPSFETTRPRGVRGV